MFGITLSARHKLAFVVALVAGACAAKHLGSTSVAFELKNESPQLGPTRSFTWKLGPSGDDATVVGSYSAISNKVIGLRIVKSGLGYRAFQAFEVPKLGYVNTWGPTQHGFWRFFRSSGTLEYHEPGHVPQVYAAPTECNYNTARLMGVVGDALIAPCQDGSLCLYPNAEPPLAGGIPYPQILGPCWTVTPYRNAARIMDEKSVWILAASGHLHLIPPGANDAAPAWDRQGDMTACWLEYSNEGGVVVASKWQDDQWMDFRSEVVGFSHAQCLLAADGPALFLVIFVYKQGTTSVSVYPEFGAPVDHWEAGPSAKLLDARWWSRNAVRIFWSEDGRLMTRLVGTRRVSDRSAPSGRD